jgi:hypothetical protein
MRKRLNSVPFGPLLRAGTQGPKPRAPVGDTIGKVCGSINNPTVQISHTVNFALTSTRNVLLELHEMTESTRRTRLGLHRRG